VWHKHVHKTATFVEKDILVKRQLIVPIHTISYIKNKSCNKLWIILYISVYNIHITLHQQVSLLKMYSPSTGVELPTNIYISEISVNS